VRFVMSRKSTTLVAFFTNMFAKAVPVTERADGRSVRAPDLASPRSACCHATIFGVLGAEVS
jgi:hypothetical protein